MNHSESIKELAAALAKAQGEMEGAPKDAKNQFGGFYANLGSVIQAAQKPLSTNGLSITQHPELVDGMVTVTTMLMHASGEWLESSISAPIGDNRALSAAQQAAIVITYLRRYSYAAIVGIYADEDTDGAAPQQTRQPAPAKPAAPKPAPAAETPAKPEPTMTLEEALNIVSSEGELYGNISTEKLGFMANAITKKNRSANPGTAEEIAERNRKYAAIDIILAHRQSAQ